MDNKLGVFLNKIRLEKNLSLRDFADLLGLSHTYLSKIEAGVNSRNGKPIAPTIDTLIQIANALGLELTELLDISGYIQGDSTWDNETETLTTNYHEKIDSNLNHKIDTIAAHHEGDWTEEELAEIEKFKEFVKAKRSK